MSPYRPDPIVDSLDWPIWVQKTILYAGGLAIVVAFGCSPSVKKQWTPIDASSASDIAGASTSLEAICDRSGGSCNPAAVRSIEQSIFCAARAMAQRHGDPVPTGPACPSTTESK